MLATNILSRVERIQQYISIDTVAMETIWCDDNTANLNLPRLAIPQVTIATVSKELGRVCQLYFAKLLTGTMSTNVQNIKWLPLKL